MRPQYRTSMPWWKVYANFPCALRLLKTSRGGEGGRAIVWKTSVTGLVPTRKGPLLCILSPRGKAAVDRVRFWMPGHRVDLYHIKPYYSLASFKKTGTDKASIQGWRWTKTGKLPVLSSQHETEDSSCTWATWGLKEQLDKREGKGDSSFHGWEVHLGTTRSRWEAACSQVTAH